MRGKPRDRRFKPRPRADRQPRSRLKTPVTIEDARELSVVQASSKGSQVSKPNRIDRLREASKGTQAKPVVVETEFSSVPQATESSVQSSGQGRESVVKASESPEQCAPSLCCAVVNGAESARSTLESGAGADLPLHQVGERGSIRDTRLVGKAIQQRWPIPESTRLKMIARLDAALESESFKEFSVAVRGIVACDTLNLAQEKHNDPAAQVHVNVNLDATQRASEIKTLLGESVTRRLGVDDPSG